MPVNPLNLRPRQLGIICVSLAGIAVNAAIAVFAALLFRVTGGNLGTLWGGILIMFVYINLLLAIFNLLPIPPLDGSRIFLMWLPYNVAIAMVRWSLVFIVFIFLALPWLPVWPILGFCLRILIGITIV